MTDLATRLAAALDREEREATAGVSDGPPGVVLRLIARDRPLLDRHRPLFGDGGDDDLCKRCGDPWPCRDLEDAAAFWMPEAAGA